MRLLRVIETKRVIRDLVYLKNYRKIAVLYQSGEVEFFGVFSGKSERKVSVNEYRPESMFLMEDKNVIGVMNYWQSKIEFIQLHAEEVLGEH